MKNFIKYTLIILIALLLITFSASCKISIREAPTIKLEIYEGPDYITGFCVYRVEAIVTGYPKPEVSFSKDDSLGSAGKYKCQVNLENPQEPYLLEATAKNSMGEATDHLLLEWSCEEETEEGEEEEKGTPTIELEIYQGPLYSSLSDICYYRVRANVTGTPFPDVEFSKDDSGGACGKYKTQVNLNNHSDTYTLIATATNSKGSASDSINLRWGCIDLEDLETEIINLINNIRVQNGLTQLLTSQPLTDIARSRSTDMIINSYFSHYTPDGRNIFNILGENGVSYINAGENIAECTPASPGTPEVFTNAWMASPTHKYNMLRPMYRYIGVGIIEEEDRMVVTAIFLN